MISSALTQKIRQQILNKIEKYLALDPKKLGKPLTGQFQGLWRYRFGNFRVIYEIMANQLRIIIIRIGHRKNIYKSH